MQPPKLASRFFAWYCRHERYEELQGDLEEMFARDLKRGRTVFWSQIRYWWNVIRCARSYAFSKSDSDFQSTNPVLFLMRSNFKLINRHFFKNKFYALLNIGGLTLSFAACLFIGLYVYNELNFESFHAQRDRICRVSYEVATADNVTAWARVPEAYVNELPEVVPGIEKLIRFQNHDTKYFKVGEKKFQEEHIYVTDAEVFDVFSFALAVGDPQSALAEPHSMVISQELASRYFGAASAVGQQIAVTSSWNAEPVIYKVTGVMKNLPENTHLPVNVLMSFASPAERQWWAYVYVLLEPNADLSLVQQQIDTFVDSQPTEGSAKVSFSLQHLSDIHLHSNLAREIVPNGSAQNVKMLVLIGLLILLIGVINFTNLSNILSLYRSKEMGIRKFLGARIGNVVSGAVLESVYYSFMAMAVAASMAVLLYPAFERFTHNTGDLPWMWLMAGALALVLLVGVIGSMYPVWIAGKIGALNLLRFRYQLSGGRRITAKQVMLTFQFAISVLLLACTFMVQRQFVFMQNQQLALHAEEILAVPGVPDTVTAGFSTFREAVLDIPGIKQVSACMEVPSREIRDIGPFQVADLHQTEEEAPFFDVQVVDYRYFDLMQMQFVAGEPIAEKVYWEVPQFTEQYSHIDYLRDQPRSYVINESAARLLGFENSGDALGHQGKWSIGEMRLAQGPIVGVVKDFHQETMKNKVDPTVYLFEPIWMKTFLVRLETAHMSETIDLMEARWNEIFPAYPMAFRFVDDLYDQLYRKERQQLDLLYMFSVLAIVIAFVGLLGMVTFTLQTRMKELAVRKVLGADLWSIIRLLSNQYLLLLIIGLAMAIPGSYFLASLWLSDFAYHVEVAWWSFGLIFLLIAGLLLGIVASQTRRTIRVNPAEILRDE